MFKIFIIKVLSWNGFNCYLKDLDLIDYILKISFVCTKYIFNIYLMVNDISKLILKGRS